MVAGNATDGAMGPSGQDHADGGLSGGASNWYGVPPAYGELNGNDATGGAAGGQKVCTCGDATSSAGGQGGAAVADGGQLPGPGLPSYGGDAGTGAPGHNGSACGAGGSPAMSGIDGPAAAALSPNDLLGTVSASGWTTTNGVAGTTGQPGQGGGGGGDGPAAMGAGGGGACGGCGGAGGGAAALAADRRSPSSRISPRSRSWAPRSRRTMPETVVPAATAKPGSRAASSEAPKREAGALAAAAAPVPAATAAKVAPEVCLSESATRAQRRPLTATPSPQDRRRPASSWVARESRG